MLLPLSIPGESQSLMEAVQESNRNTVATSRRMHGAHKTFVSNTSAKGEVIAKAVKSWLVG